MSEVSIENPFNWAVIGSGRIADTVMQECVKSGRHKVVSVYSRTMSRAEEYARKFGATAYGSLAEAALAKGVEGVYIATPHSAHYGEILECIALGVPVLSEKAFTINSRQVEEIIRRKDEANIYVSEAMWTRYNPITKRIKDIIVSGKLGEIKSFEASFCYSMNLANFPERVVKPEYGGGALLDVGVYPISYAEMLFGMPENISASMKINKYGVDKSNKVVMQYGGGLRCSVASAIDHFSTCSMTVKGTEGKIFVPLFYRPKTAFLNIDGKREIISSRAGYIHQFDKVASDIRDGKTESGEIPLCDSLKVMTILDAVRDECNLRYPDGIESV